MSCSEESTLNPRSYRSHIFSLWNVFPVPIWQLQGIWVNKVSFTHTHIHGHSYGNTHAHTQKHTHPHKNIHQCIHFQPVRCRKRQVLSCSSNFVIPFISSRRAILEGNKVERYKEVLMFLVHKTSHSDNKNYRWNNMINNNKGLIRNQRESLKICHNKLEGNFITKNLPLLHSKVITTYSKEKERSQPNIAS